MKKTCGEIRTFKQITGVTPSEWKESKI